MMIEKSGSIELRDISLADDVTPEMREVAAGMVRVNHLYRSALKVAVTQMEILDEEFAGLYDHAHIQDMAGVRVICNYLDDIYYLRGLLTRTESFRVLRETDYIKAPKETGYRSLHLIVEVPIVISEGTLKLPVEIQLRTIAMDMWASLEHELRYKSDRHWGEAEITRLRLCSEAIYEVDREMQNIYQGKGPEYED